MTPRPASRTQAFGTGLALALLALGGGPACDGGATPTAPPLPPPVAPPPPPVELPADPDALFLVVEMGGGFVPIEYSLGQPPLFALSVGGELWSRAPVPEIYPGPLVPGILHSRIGEEAFDTVLGFIAELGLPDVAVDELEMIRQPEDGPILADAPGVEVRFTDPAGSRRLVIEAFVSSSHRDPRVDQVRDLVEHLDGSVPPDAPAWSGERLQVWAGPAEAFHDPELAVVRPWPLAEPPHGEDHFVCQVLEGRPARDLFETLQSAHHGFRWENQGALYQVLGRWLIPGEPTCEG